MSEPYEPHFKRCEGCGEDVQPEEWDKETGYCAYCLAVPNPTTEREGV